MALAASVTGCVVFTEVWETTTGWETIVALAGVAFEAWIFSATLTACTATISTFLSTNAFLPFDFVETFEDFFPDFFPDFLIDLLTSFLEAFSALCLCFFKLFTSLLLFLAEETAFFEALRDFLADAIAFLAIEIALLESLAAFMATAFAAFFYFGVELD